MELIGYVEADEEVQCVAVAVQGPFALCSVALVVLLQHQIIAGSPASLQKLVPPSDSEEKSKSSSLFQQLARSAPLLFSAFKKPSPPEFQVWRLFCLMGINGP